MNELQQSTSTVYYSVRWQGTVCGGNDEQTPLRTDEMTSVATLMMRLFGTRFCSGWQQSCTDPFSKMTTPLRELGFLKEPCGVWGGKVMECCASSSDFNPVEHFRISSGVLSDHQWMATTTVAKLRQSLVEGREAWGPEVACDQHEDEEVAPYSSQARYFVQRLNKCLFLCY